MVPPPHRLTGQGVEFHQTVNLIPEKLNSNSIFPCRDGHNLYHIPPYPELTPNKIYLIALIQYLHQPVQELIPPYLHPWTQGHHHIKIVIR
jgi:hypothetical protein